MISPIKVRVRIEKLADATYLLQCVGISHVAGFAKNVEKETLFALNLGEVSVAMRALFGCKGSLADRCAKFNQYKKDDAIDHLPKGP